MNQWTTSAYELDGLREKIETHEYIAAEAQCTEYLARHAEDITAQVIGVYLVRSQCRAALGHDEDALNDHVTAVGLMEPDLSGEALFDVANDAMNSAISLGYCAALFRRSANLLEASDDTGDRSIIKLTAAAYNKEGICHFKAGHPVEDETACFIRAMEIMEGIDNPDSDELMLIALIKSNLAECLVRSEDYDRAVELYFESAAIYDTRREKSAVCAEQYAMCQRSLSDIYRRQEDYIHSHQCLSRAIQALEEHPDGATDQITSQLASCFNSRGTLRYNIGDFEGEVDDCTIAIELRQQSEPEYFGLATVYANRAEAYERLEEYECAAQDYRSAIESLRLAVDDVPLAKALIAMRYFSLGNVLGELEDFEGAIDAYTDSAAQFLAIREIDFDVYTRDQMREMESLCRLRLSQLAYEAPSCSYHIAMTEMRRAIALLEELDPNPMRIMRLGSMHVAMGELYEIFDELECAAEEYRVAEELRRQLGDSFADLSAQEDEAVDDEDDVGAYSPGDIPQA